MAKATKSQQERVHGMGRFKSKKEDKGGSMPKHSYKGRPVTPGSHTGRTVPPFADGPRQRWLDDQGREHPNRKLARQHSKNKNFAPKLVRG